MTRVRFTYANFPNLWDDIITHAEISALVRLREVDRTLRAAIDKRVRHLVLTPLFATDPVEAPEGAKVATPAGSLPLLELGHLDPRSLTKDQFLLLRTTRILDVQGYFHPEFDFRKLHFPSLDTLRMTLDADGTFTPYVPFAPRTVVLFTSPHGLEANKATPYIRALEEGGLHEWDSDDSDDIGLSMDWPNPPDRSDFLEDLLPGHLSAESFGDTTRTAVVNIGMAQFPERSFRSLAHPAEHLEEVVLVLPLDCPPGLGPDAYQTTEVMRASTARHTIVGSDLDYGANPHWHRVDDWPSSWMDSLRSELEGTLCSATLPEVDYTLDDNYTLQMTAEERWTRERKSKRLRAAWAKRTFEAERDRADGQASEGLRHSHGRRAQLGRKAGIHRLLQDATSRLVSLQQCIEDRLARIEYLTLSEYKERVGEETAALHTSARYADTGKSLFRMPWEWDFPVPPLGQST